MNFDDLEALVNKKSNVPQEETVEPNRPTYDNRPSYDSKPKYEKKPYDKNKVNMYEVENIPSKEIDTDIFEKVGRSFAVHAYGADEDALKKILIVANILIEEGFVFRHDGNESDILQNSILGIDNIKVESYIPYVKFNKDAKNPIISNFFELPFNYAAHLYGQKYNDIKKGARGAYASKVQALLGKECTNPVDFLLCYSPDGAESYPRYVKGQNIDYTKLGTLGFYLKIIDKCGIATYNFKNNESVSSLLKLVR